MASRQQTLHELIEPSVQALGFELWGIEYAAQGKHSILRIYIESPKGVNVDDCASVSHQVDGVLEVESPIAGQFTLEVSSPGVDRLLFTEAQYQQYIGYGLAVKLREPFEERRKYTGILKAVENGEITVHVDDHEYVLPIDSIDKAKLVYTDA